MITLSDWGHVRGREESFWSPEKYQVEKVWLLSLPKTRRLVDNLVEKGIMNNVNDWARRTRWYVGKLAFLEDQLGGCLQSCKWALLVSHLFPLVTVLMDFYIHSRLWQSGRLYSLELKYQRKWFQHRGIWWSSHWDYGVRGFNQCKCSTAAIIRWQVWYSMVALQANMWI
jgi:hypothetical protein